MATETDEKSLAYAEAVDPTTGAIEVHYIRTLGSLTGSYLRTALCGVNPPQGYRRVAFVHVEGYKTAISAATCAGCLSAAAEMGGKVPTGA
jgi:hypothetical protein